MSEIEIVDNKIHINDLKVKAKERFGDMVKAVVDIKKQIMAVGGEMHADEEAVLLNENSKQEDLWGINLYVDESGEDFIEFDSMINIRPRQNNRSRDIDDKEIKREIIKIVEKLVEYESNP